MPINGITGQYGSSIFNFSYFSNYENIITHLQQTWKIQNKVTHGSTIYYNCFK